MTGTAAITLQIEMPFAPAAARRRKVSERVFRAVVFLRKQKIRVYRADGRNWRVGHHNADTRQLLKVARTLGWQP